jgi:hypothetical protein
MIPYCSINFLSSFALCTDALSHTSIRTKMVHGRVRAPSSQTLRVSANEVRSRVAPPKGTDLFLLSQTGISKRDVITYS